MNHHGEKNSFKEVQRNPYDQLYVVENVLKQRKKKGKIQCLIKWKGYSNKHNSWEPKSVVRYVTSSSMIAQQNVHNGKVVSNISTNQRHGMKPTGFLCSPIKTNRGKISAKEIKPGKIEPTTSNTIGSIKSKNENDESPRTAKNPSPSKGRSVNANLNNSTEKENRKLIVPKLLKGKKTCLKTEANSEDDTDKYTYAVREAVTCISKVIDKHGRGFASDDALVLAILLYLQITQKFHDNIAYLYEKVRKANIPMELYFQLKMHEPIAEGKRSDKELMDKLMEEYGRLK